jgi:hypothetical protein
MVTGGKAWLELDADHTLNRHSRRWTGRRAKTIVQVRTNIYGHTVQPRIQETHP